MLDIVYNQSIPLKQLNGTTALSETDKYYYANLLKYMKTLWLKQFRDQYWFYF